MKQIYTIFLFLLTLSAFSQCCPCRTPGSTPPVDEECCYTIGAQAPNRGYINLTAGLTCEGTPTANYLISWRDNTGTEIFQSAAGTHFVSGETYAHPTTQIPAPSGPLFPIILESDAITDSPADCISPTFVSPLTCSGGSEITYNASGGLQAMITQDIEIEPNTNNLYLCFDTDDVADQITIQYNGAEIYNSGFVSTGFNTTCVNVPVNYVSGIDIITMTVENAEPDLNTIYKASLECCDPFDCNTFQIPDLVITESEANCGCDLITGSSLSSILLNTCGFAYSDRTRSSFIDFGGGCTDLFASGGVACVDNAVDIIFNAANDITIDFTLPSQYNLLKAEIQTYTSNPAVYTRLAIREVNCASDGTFFNLTMFPSYNTFTFDDVAFSINIIYDTNNIYDTDLDCTDCLATLESRYESAVNATSDPTNGIFGSYPALRSIQSRIVSPGQLREAVNYRDFYESDECDDERLYQFRYQNADCPCDSWQMYEDTNGDGTYDTLVDEKAYNGTCP